MIGSILHRPARLRITARILRLVMREQADLLLHGRLAEPRVALAHGYRFRFPTMESAFAEALGKPAPVAPAAMDSPFDRLLLGDGAATLPEAFRQQFLGTPDDDRETFFSGTMDSVWRRHPWLSPIFAILARADTLFPETGRDIPATMVVRTFRTGTVARGRPGNGHSTSVTFDVGSTPT